MDHPEQKIVPISGDSIEPVDASGPSSVDLLAATLRADVDDLALYERVLTNTLSELLPAGVIEIERDRKLADRIAGRPGEVRAIRLMFGDHLLELNAGRGGPTCFDAHVVRGVVISKKQVRVEEWARLFAVHLSEQAAESAAASAALARLLHAE